MEFYWRVFFTSVLLISMLAATESAPVMRRFGFKKKATEVKVVMDEIGDYRTYYYQQTLDHFTYTKESYKTFSQKYVLNTKYWGGAERKSPIFVYLGGEGALYADTTILTAEAPNMKALLLFIEHRYYGESYPFDKSTFKANHLGYLSSEQALADFAEIISFVKKNMSAQHCPVIVHGGSYAGMLAFWLRLKYPHIALGAYASSAPILYFLESNKEDLYPPVVSNDFEIGTEIERMPIDGGWEVLGLASDHLASLPIPTIYHRISFLLLLVGFVSLYSQYLKFDSHSRGYFV